MYILNDIVQLYILNYEIVQLYISLLQKVFIVNFRDILLENDVHTEEQEGK